jgi:hypothetical protein
MLRWATDATALSLTLAVLPALLVLPACGSSSNPATGSDASTSDSSTDAGTTDASGETSTESGVDAGPDCGSLPPTGKQLVASMDPVVVLGMTGDGNAVYWDLTTEVIFGVPIAGGSPSTIGKMTSQGRTLWANGSKAILYLPAATDPFTAIAPLSSWSAAGGTHVISTSALAQDSYFYTYDVSQDGAYVAYFATTDGMSGTLTVSTVDGKTQTPLAMNVDLTANGSTGAVCYPMVQFAGDTVIAQYCSTPEPATVVSTIATFAAPTFAPVTIVSMFTPTNSPIGVDPTGKLLLLPGAAGGLDLYPIAGGAPVVVDANAAGAVFTASGDILYTNTSGALLRYSATTHMATMLVASGLGFPLYLSPDGNWLQAASTQDATTQLTDLYVLSTTTPGTAKPVVNTATVSAFGFSADSKYSAFGTNFPTVSAGTFDFEASLSAGGAPTKVLSAVTLPLPTHGSKLVGNINQSKVTGAADIVALDLSSTAKPTTLVTQADPDLFLTKTKDVLYSWYCEPNGMSGVWTLTPP